MVKERKKKSQKSRRKLQVLKFSLKDWGSPHGIAGEPNPYNEDEINHAVFYRMGLSPNGAHFEIFQEKHHTEIDIENAKKWLRINQDVLSIKVVKEVV